MASPYETFDSYIASNKRLSFFLMFSLVALLGVVGAAFGGTIGDGSPEAMMAFGSLALAGGTIASIVSYLSGAKVVLGIAGATPLSKLDDPELFNVVEEMAIAAGLPMPAVYLIDDNALNAFATGRDPQNAAIAITRGLREELSREELQGVIAHEMGHILNFDIRLMMVAAVIGGTTALLTDSMFRVRRGTSRRRANNSDGGGLLLAFAVVLAILAPIVAKLLQLSISRKREFLADATSVRLTRNPIGLISALKKLAAHTDPLDHPNRAMEHLYIVSPTKKLHAANIDSPWSTHPPLEERIRRLEALLG